jgi:hypothetical protein
MSKYRWVCYNENRLQQTVFVNNIREATMKKNATTNAEDYYQPT